jgi:acyl-CoA thioesterase-1
MFLRPNDTLLFQGDSITDCGRDYTDPASLGRGYASISSAFLQALHPHLNLTCLNRGISGHRTRDLLDRWDEDCLQLKPDVLSLLIGINNVWRRYDSNDPTANDIFATEYRELLNRTRAALPDVRLVLIEPFVLPIPEDRRQWREDLDPKISLIRDLARDFEARYIPLDGLFAAAASTREAAYWADDGVHPTVAGHGLIAHHWLRTVGAL